LRRWAKVSEQISLRKDVLHLERVLVVRVLLDVHQLVFWHDGDLLYHVLEFVRLLHYMHPFNSKDFAEKVVNLEFGIQTCGWVVQDHFRVLDFVLG